MRSTLTRVLVALLACEFIALKLFASGFLLRRVETHERSLTSWSDDDDDARANKVDKVVILIVDGARYDWTTEKFGVSSSGDATTGRLRSVRALGSMCDVNGNASDGTKKRGRGKVFKFIADAPTTTQQRLKGLLTGGLPTFVDASDSFGGTTLREDNLIVSMTSRGKRLAISGDDTWLELFPGANETFTGGCEMFPSLDVKDTSTVDAGVRDHMSRALKQPESWDVLIGHMLGADHVGHTFGATGSHMARKLAENDRDIEMVADAMRADDRYTNAMLFVFGDHGMTDNGDHGGGTPEEVDSFLLAYHPWASKGVTCRSSESEEDESLPQIDFAPTMAAIMGVPTPFGNLGKVNEDVFRLALSADLSSDDGFDWRAAYVRALRANIEQVWNYTQSYSDDATSPFRGDIAARLDSMMETPRSNDSKEHILELLREVADVARVRWTQFGLMSMVLGFGALVAALIVHAILAYGPPKECSHMDSTAVLGMFMVLLASLARLSNSFIVGEREMMQFLFATFVLALMVKGMAKREDEFEGTQSVEVVKGTVQCLLSNFFLYALGSSWVKSDSAFTFSQLVTVTIAACTLGGGAMLVYSIHRDEDLTRFECSKKYVKVAICGWIAVVLRSASVLIFGVEEYWLPHVTYLSSIVVLIKVVHARSDNDIGHRCTLFLLAVSSTVTLLAGPTMGAAYVFSSYKLFRGVFRLVQVAYHPIHKASTRAIETTLAIGLWLATSVVFFGGGHTCSFNGLHFAAAFTGFRKFNYYGMGFLLGLETWSGEVLLAAFVPMFAHHLTSFNQFGKQFRDCGHTPAMSLWAKITLCRALVSTCAALCAALHRRHLMVWAIFAPKFVFDAVGASVGNALTIISIFLFTGFTGRTGKYDKFD